MRDRIHLGVIDLPGPVADVVPDRPCRAARLLVRWQGRPLGWIAVPVHGAEGVPAAAIRHALTDPFGPLLLSAALMPESARPAEPPRPFSVVVCTRDRPELLAGCLAALAALDYPDYEVVVIDNASLTDATARVAAAAGVRCVREDRPGLDAARNRGLAEARHELIAFTDDDARVDRGWLRAINEAFQPDVAAVTGFVAPLELETAAQCYFEDVYGGMAHGFLPRRIAPDLQDERQRLWASAWGVGANMAFRRRLFDAVGGFDVALDVGTPSRGGGDLEMFHRTVAHGYPLVYEPRALVWHRHRLDDDGLRRQLFDNGCGFGAYLLACARRRSVPRLTLARFVLQDWLGGWLLRRLVRPGLHRRSLTWMEIRGMLHSPRAYRAARQGTRAAAATTPAPSSHARPATNARP